MQTYESNPTFRAVARAFVHVEAKTNFPAAAGLAMGACESAWFTRLTGDWNYWGITRYPEAGPAKLCDTHEDLLPTQLASFRWDERATAVFVAPLGNGKIRYAMKRWFASYGSLEESVQAYVEFFTQSPKRYRAAWGQYLADREQFPQTAATSLLKAICEAGYATGDAETVELEIMSQANILHAVEMARQELLSAHLPNQPLPPVT